MRPVSPGTRIGEYILERQLGAGGFAEVWLAHHHIWGEEERAIKIARDEAYGRYLKREGMILHKLAHPRIVRTFGLDPGYDPPYLVAEYVAGGSLRDLLARRGRLAPYRALELLEESLEGLSFAQGEGVIHRDLKPENILLEDGHAKLSDFGLGSIAGPMTLSSVFQSGDGRAGTPLYLSPEQKVGEELDGRSDLYALGLIFFECLTGNLPAGPEVPGELVPGLPGGFDQVYRTLCSRKEKRYASSDAALADVRRLWDVVGRPPPAGNGSRRSPPSPAPATADDGCFERASAASPAEAGPATGPTPLARAAGLVPRLYAHAVDAFLLVWLFVLLSFEGASRILVPIVPVFHFFYTVIMTAAWGGTLGKLLVGLRVRSLDGAPVDFFQSFLRYTIAVVTAGIGLVACAFDRSKRGIHDHAANTIVVWR